MSVQYISMKSMDTFRVKSYEFFLVCPCVLHHPGTNTAENVFVIKCHCWSTLSDKGSTFRCTHNKCLWVETACCDWMKPNLLINDLTWATGTSFTQQSLIQPVISERYQSKQTSWPSSCFRRTQLTVHLSFGIPLTKLIHTNCQMFILVSGGAPLHYKLSQKIP